MRYLLYYLLGINFVSFFLMGLDKFKARRNLWRIPERVLFGSAALGGSVGAILGMQIFRHKTRHKSFAAGIPAILILQLLLAGFLLWKFGGFGSRACG